MPGCRRGGRPGHDALAEASLAVLIHPNAARDVRDDLVAMSVRVGAEVYVRQK